MADIETPAQPTVEQIVSITQVAIQSLMDSVAEAVKDGRVTSLTQALAHLDAYNQGVQSF